jgi:ketosteroid isomerase-like protein
MSQENVEVVQAFFDAWNTGDMEAVRELYDPEVIARTAEGWPEPGPYVGRDVVMRWFEQLRQTWGGTDTVVPVDDFVHAADHVAVKYLWRGAGSGPDLEMRGTIVFTVRNKRIFGHEFFWDHAEALKAVGLAE